MQHYKVLILSHHSCAAGGQKYSSFFHCWAHHGFPLSASMTTTHMCLLTFYYMVLSMLLLPTHEETTHILAAVS